ncbi:MAG: right-handed parallel beta-helix repeat-containing protein [Gammaproteobacteria bacterium]
MRALVRIRRAYCPLPALPLAVVGAVLSAHATAAPSPRTYIVCPAEKPASKCNFKGDTGIQAAIDKATSGDTIQIKAGRYAPAAYREVVYKDFTVRTYLLVEGKALTITGEPGTILDGSTKLPTTALTIHNAEVTIKNLEIANFRWDIQEDEFYDGHGIFVIDARARIDNVTIRNVQKMALTGRGDTLLDVSNLRILDGHVGLWLHESAYMRLTHSIIRGNISGGIAAYDDSVAHISNCVFDANEDDGLYTEHRAAIYATNSLILRNKPIAVHAMNDSNIWVNYSVLFGNAADEGAQDKAQVHVGTGIIKGDPRVDANYNLLPDSPLKGKGDPDFGTPVGSPSEIGPSWVRPTHP